METIKIKVTEVNQVTHDTYMFKTTKPEGYEFEPGQATELSLLREGWEEEKRPFTFTSLPNQDFLEFVIKTYPSHDGVTEQLSDVKVRDEFEIGEAWGAINYKGEGTFLAGGAGVTPFISILRDLKQKGKVGNNQLIFANKTEKDIILHDELKDILNGNLINILSDEEKQEYHHGLIDKEFIQEHVDDFDKKFYVCGPPEFNDKMNKDLKELGANPDSLVFEG